MIPLVTRLRHSFRHPEFSSFPPTKYVQPPSVPAIKAVRRWVVITSEGAFETKELSNWNVHQQLGTQLRDLRLLDPAMQASFPAAILARDRAIIVNLDFIKMIIRLDRCYVTCVDDPDAALFMHELQRRLKHRHESTTAVGDMHSMKHLVHVDTDQHPPVVGVAGNQQQQRDPSSGCGSSMLSSIHYQDGACSLHMELPFELRVLEIALDVMTNCLDVQVQELEVATHPSLDDLTRKISSLHLEKVRKIKNQLARFATRVATLKEVFERLLADTSNMRELNLSGREVALLHRHSLRASAAATPLDMFIPASAGTANGCRGNARVDTATPRSQGRRVTNSDISAVFEDMEGEEDDEDVVMVEQLLESYLMRIDSTTTRVQGLTEYIDDTEDYITIELDSHRNELIRLNLILSTATTAIGAITAVTSLFAMNVVLAPGITDKAPYSWFLAITLSTVLGSVSLFAGVIAYARFRQLV